MTRRTLGFAALAVLILVVGGALVSWYALRTWVPQFTRERVEALLADGLGQPVRVGEVRLHPWRARLSVSNVVSDGLDDGLAIRVPAADVDVTLASLWRRRLVLAITFHDLDVRLTGRLDGAGGGASPFPLPESFAAGPLRVEIGSVRVVRGHAVLREPDRRLALELRAANAEARPAAGDLDVSLEVGGARLESGGVFADVEAVGLDTKLSADSIQIRRFGWRWHGESLRADGAIRAPWGGAPELGVRLDGALPLAPLASMLGVREGVAGVARVTAGVAGPLGSPRVDGRVSVPTLTVAGVSARDVSIDGRLADGAVRLEKIQAAFGTGRLTASATATPVTGAVTRVAVDVRDLTLPEPLTPLGPGTGIVEATVERGEVQLRRGHVAWRAATLDVGGRIDTAGPLAVNVRLAGDLAGVGKAMGAGDLAGRATLTADVTGTLGAPEVAGRAIVTGLAAGGQSVDPAEASFRLAVAPPTGASARRWDGTIQSSRIGWPAAPIEDLTARLTIDGTRLEIVSARARAATVPVEAAGVWEWTGAGRARATLGPAALASVPFVPAALGLRGTARGQVDATARQGVIDTSATIQLARTSAGALPLGDGTLSVRTRGRALQAELAMPSRALRVEASGPLQAGSTIAARLFLDGLVLRTLLADLASGAADHVDGRVSARGDLSIPFDDPSRAQGVVQVQPEGLRLLGEPWTSRAPITLRWQDGRALVERLRLEGAGGTLTASGTLAGSGTETLAVALDNAPLPGALAALGRGALRADLRIADSALEVKRLDGRWPGLVVGAAGRFGGDGAIALDVTSDADLAALPRAAAAGRASASLRVRGSLDALQATGELRAPRIQASGVVLSDVRLPLRFSPNVLHVADGQALLGGRRITLTGTAAWSGADVPTTRALAREVRVTADLRAPAVRLEELATLLPAPLHGRGDLALVAHVEGTPSRWRGTGTLSSAAAELAMGPLRRLQVPFTLDESGIDAPDVRLDLDSVPVRGAAGWRWAGGGHASVTLGPAELGSLTTIPFALGARGTGRATLRATIDASAGVTGEAHAAFDRVVVSGFTLGNGRFDVSARDRGFRADMEFPEPRLRATASGQVDAQQVLQAQATVSGSGGGVVTAKGSVAQSGALDARVEGRLPLAMLPALQPQILEAGGTLEIAVRAHGSARAPVLTGDGTIRKASLLLRDRPEALRDLDARFSLSNQGIQLHEATGSLSGGTIEARGTAALEGWRIGAYRVRTTARSVSVAILDGLTSAWDADLELAGTGGEARLRGDVKLVRGVYARDISLLPLLLASRREAAQEEGLPLRLSLRVRLDDNLAVRSRTVDLRATGRLNVEGTAARPAISGSIVAQDGRVQFRNHDWTVTSASVRFTDPRRIDPYLDVIAQARIREYDVSLHVTGPTSAISVEMSSVPRLARDDLLALVAFGSTRAELADSPGTVVLGEAGRIIARDFLGIDPGSKGLRVSAGAASDGPTTTHTWEGEDPRTYPSRNAPNDRKQRVRIEYRLLDPLYLSTEYDLDGGYGADLVFRFRFR